jgi:hypothetical protein
MNRNERWEKKDIHWLLAIVALVALILIGWLIYYSMSVRMDQPHKKAAQAPIGVSAQPQLARSWTSHRV